MSEVAIAVVSYNQGQFIGELFQSLAESTYKDFSVFVLDVNSSPLDILDMQIEKYKKYFKIVSSVIDEVLPIGISRYVAVKEAIGYFRPKYIAIVDADDFWTRDKLEQQVQVMKNHPEAGLCFSDCFYYNDEKQLTEDKTFFQKHKPYKEDHFWKLLTKRNYMPCPTLLFDAEKLMEVYKPTHYTSAEDFDMVLKMTNKWEAICQDFPLAYYRIHYQQVSRNKTRCAMEEIDAIKDACSLRDLTQRQKERVYIHLLWLYVKLLFKELKQAEDYIRDGEEK